MCKKCKMVKRGKKQFVICPENARHKQRQGFHTIAGVPVSSAPLDLLTNRMWTRFVATPSSAAAPVTVSEVVAADDLHLC